jgi:4-hydroxy-3-polyprenylbenzoate decarboxylase
LAIGKERYTPFQNATRPAELLTLANRVLGTGQLSLAKYLFITADPSQQLTTKNIQAFFEFVLERVDWKRDVHFQTQTTIDTLDYTGGRLNEGSKVVIAAYGNPIRSLATHVAAIECDILHTVSLVMPGVAAISMEGNKVSRDYIDLIKRYQDDYPSIVLWTVVDDVAFVCESLSNWLWVTFTRSNPATDIDGVEAFYEHKHWGCKGALVIDARNKAHHAPALCLDPATEERVKRFKQTDIGQWL